MEGRIKDKQINGTAERGRLRRETKAKPKGKKEEDEMREQQCRRLLPGSLSCTHICLQRV